MQSLSIWWDKITLIGKINSYNIAETIINDMEETKYKFSELQESLIYNLLLEHLKSGHTMIAPVLKLRLIY